MEKTPAPPAAEIVREEDVFVHDLKNILLGIVGNLSLASATANTKDPSHRFILSASQSASRACRFAEEWIRDRHRSLSEKSALCLPDLIRDCFSICEVADKHRFKIFGARACPKIEGNPYRLRQVFNNLLSNAIQSTPGSGRIHVYLKVVNGFTGDPPDGLSSGARYLTAAFEDDGPGIPPEYRDQIFNRGFSTKKTGCGVGLAGARQMMQADGGTLSLGKGKLGGACIIAWIPLHATAKTVYSHRPSKTAPGGMPEVLVMDDEPMVREVLGEMLSMLGFLPRFAESGEQAVTLYQDRVASGQPFSFVVLDLNVPGGVGGEQIIQRLHALAPDIKAVVTSGMVSNRALRHFAAYGFSARLPKPYSIADLARVVESLEISLPGRPACP